MNVINLCQDIINFEFTKKNTKDNLIIINNLEVLHNYENITKICYITNDKNITLLNCSKKFIELSDYIALNIEKIYNTDSIMIFLIHKDYITADDVTYIIAGYTSEICNINRILCFSHGKFIQSTIDNYTEKDNNNIANAGKNGYKIERNMYNQMYNIYRVLDTVDTKYCIKMRSDEYYLDMEEFIEIMKKEEHKLITNNLFFIGKEYYICDHLFGSDTEHFKNMITNLKNILENKIKINDMFLSHTEKVFGISFIYNIYSENELIKNQKEILLNNFYLYDIDKFTNYIISTNNSIVSRKIIDKYSGRNRFIQVKERIYLSKNSGYKYNQFGKKELLNNSNNIKKSFIIIKQIEDVIF